MNREQVTALRRCMDLLAVRCYSRTELAARLRREEFPAEEIESAVSECVQRRYLDDETLAGDLVSTLRGRNYGAGRIAQKLRQKGLESAVTADLADPEAELTAASAALEAKLRLLTNEHDLRKKRAKLFRHLIGRGFAPEVVFKVIGRAGLAGDDGGF